MSPEEDICEMFDRSTKVNISTATEFYLTSANLESSINDYLIKNGILIDPKTRLFLANLRAVMGTMARRAKNAA